MECDPQANLESRFTRLQIPEILDEMSGRGGPLRIWIGTCGCNQLNSGQIETPIDEGASLNHNYRSSKCVVYRAQYLDVPLDVQL